MCIPQRTFSAGSAELWRGSCFETVAFTAVLLCKKHTQLRMWSYMHVKHARNILQNLSMLRYVLTAHPCILTCLGCSLAITMTAADLTGMCKC